MVISKLEFMEVIKHFEVSFLSEDEYEWHDIKIKFTGCSCKIEGKIPFKVEQDICNHYLNNRYRIKANDTYEEIDQSKEKIYFYKIYSKEGMLLFLIKLHNYFAKIENKSLITKEESLELLNQLHLEMINKVYPFDNTKTWLEKNTEHAHLFQKKQKDYQLYSLLEKFDDTINPFMNQNILLDDVQNFLNNVGLRYKSLNPGFKIVIWDRETGYSTHIERTSTGFSYGISYQKDNCNKTVIHYFYPIEGSTYYQTEGLKININQENINIDLRTNQMSSNSCQEEKILTNEAKKELMKLLNEALEEASKITIENMVIPSLIRKN